MSKKIKEILRPDELRKLQTKLGGQLVYIPKLRRMGNNLIKARYKKVLKEKGLKRSVIVAEQVAEEFSMTLRNFYRVIRK